MAEIKLEQGNFPIDISKYKPLAFDLSKKGLTPADSEQLRTNIQIVRDMIVFITALSKAKGIGGHTGGAYDIVPEYLIAEAFARGDNSIHPIIYDEAGHRVAIHYVMKALNGAYGENGLEKLLHYREYGRGLPGHPESELGTVDFDSGRLGHVWGEVNGIAMANPGKKIVMLGSDGSFLEGNDAEAARIAVSRNLEVKVLFDDNDVTIAGHPSKYVPGFSLENTLKGHGMQVIVGYYTSREDLDALYSHICWALSTPGPRAVVTKRKMAPGIEGIEGTNKAHDAIDVDVAIKYFEKRGNEGSIKMLKEAKEASKVKQRVTYLGSSPKYGKCRVQFGETIANILNLMDPNQVESSLRIFDPDLEGSTGLEVIRKALEKISPDLAKKVYHNIGPQERGGILAAGGFGSEEGKQGIFATFSAFTDMIISELTMLRMGRKNLLLHFSHAGEDDMSDNTCHFGWNIFYLDSGPASQDTTRMYFGADVAQTDNIIRRIFWDKGIRVVHSTRSEVPYILDDKGQLFFGGSYAFKPGIDEEIRTGKAGYVISYGEMLYRALDAVERARKEGIDVGLINKPTLNVPDDKMMKKIGQTDFALLVESQNYKTGLGVRYSDWLHQQDIRIMYRHMGATKPGIGGQEEQIPYQELGPDHILNMIRRMSA